MSKRGRESLPDDQSSTSKASRARGPRPVWFHVDKIEVGEWIHESSLVEGLKAGMYCGRKKVVWQLDHAEAGKRRIEFPVETIRAMKFTDGKDSAAAVMELQLDKPPMFYLKKVQDGIKNTSKIDYFTTNASATNYRNHKITATTETLQEIRATILKFNSGPWNDLLNKEFKKSDDDLHFTEAEQGKT